ncbi:MAG: NAD(P)/FAD-dependent oxidoreductase [Thermoleophilia bacterium]
MRRYHDTLAPAAISHAQLLMTAPHPEFDVIIVGAGPAGIFCALELCRSSACRVLIVERGPDICDRTCPARRGGGCRNCTPCGITSGWGGAGAFSDGKLTLSTEVGGWLNEFVPADQLTELVTHVDTVWLEFGAPPTVYGGGQEAMTIAEAAARYDLTLVASPVRHMGTERARDILRRLRRELAKSAEILTRTQVTQVLVETAGRQKRVRGVELADGRQVTAGAVVLAPGREGAGWAVGEYRRLCIPLATNPVDIGVRVEVAAPTLEPLTETLYESKLRYRAPTFGDAVRTFCMNPYGEVSLENYGDVVTVNGHSYAERKTDRSNFALLVSTRFTKPFDDPNSYGKSIARLANLLGEHIIVQRLGDLAEGRRSTPERLAAGAVQPTLSGATPGDLAFVLPYRHLQNILEMLCALDHLAPGLNGPDTLLYGVEVKFYSARPTLDHGLQTPIDNLYAIGDGAGITRGLMQASAAGVVAARSILADDSSCAEHDGRGRRQRSEGSCRERL